VLLSILESSKNSSSFLLYFFVSFQNLILKDKPPRISWSITTHTLIKQVTRMKRMALGYYIKLTMSLFALFFLLPIPFFRVLSFDDLHLFKLLWLYELLNFLPGGVLRLLLVLVNRDLLNTCDWIIYLLSVTLATWSIIIIYRR